MQEVLELYEKCRKSLESLSFIKLVIKFALPSRVDAVEKCHYEAKREGEKYGLEFELLKDSSRLEVCKHGDGVTCYTGMRTLFKGGFYKIQGMKFLARTPHFEYYPIKNEEYEIFFKKLRKVLKENNAFHDDLDSMLDYYRILGSTDWVKESRMKVFSQGVYYHILSEQFADNVLKSWTKLFNDVIVLCKNF